MPPDLIQVAIVFALVLLDASHVDHKLNDKEDGPTYVESEDGLLQYIVVDQLNRVQKHEQECEDDLQDLNRVPQVLIHLKATDVE